MLQKLKSLSEIERAHILLVLDAAKGNKKLAASVLGINRKTLYRKLQDYANAKAAG